MISPGILMGGALIYSIIKNIQILEFNVFSIIIIVTTYSSLNTVVSLSQPNLIIDDGKKIEFHAFGRSHSYYWEELKFLRIKELNKTNIYLRVGNYNVLKGRYWIKTERFSDGDEMNKKLRDMEKKLHPELLKFRKRDRELLNSVTKS